MWNYLNAVFGADKTATLVPPATYDNFHKENKNVFTTLHQFDGAKVDLSSILSPKFHVTHSMQWASQMYPPTYSFGSAFVGDKTFLQGQVSSEGNVSARLNYNWFSTPLPALPSLEPVAAGSDAQSAPLTASDSMGSSAKPSGTTKVQAQLAPAGAQSMLTIEHEHIGKDFNFSLKTVNPNPIDVGPVYAGDKSTSGHNKRSTTGVYVAQFVQSITPSWAAGAEYVYQHPLPEVEESSLALALRYAPLPSKPLPPVPALPAGMPSPYHPVSPYEPQETFAATWQPSSGIAQLSFYKKVNQRLEVGSELQFFATRSNKQSREFGRREGIASVGFKLDTVFATIRGMLDTHGKVSAIIEERLAQGLSFQVMYPVIVLVSYLEATEPLLPLRGGFLEFL